MQKIGIFRLIEQKQVISFHLCFPKIKFDQKSYSRILYGIYIIEMRIAVLKYLNIVLLDIVFFLLTPFTKLYLSSDLVLQGGSAVTLSLCFCHKNMHCPVKHNILHFQLKCCGTSSACPEAFVFHFNLHDIAMSMLSNAHVQLPN